MGNAIIALVTALTFLPGIVLDYIPFAQIISKKQKRILHAAYMVAVLLNAVYYWVVESTTGMTVGAAKLNFYIFSFSVLVINLLVIRGRVREILFTYGLVSIIDFTVLALATYVVHGLFKLNGLMDYMAVGLVSCMIYVLGFRGLRKLVKGTVQPFLSIDTGNYWHMLWLVPVTMYYSLILVAPVNNDAGTIGHISGCLLIALATVTLCHSMAKDYQRMVEKHAVDQQLNMQKEYYNELAERVEEARKTRHDFKHHMAVVRKFIETDDKSGLEAYYDELMRRNVKDAIPYTGNAAVDGVVYHYSQLAKEKGIRFSFTGTIDSRGVTDVDLCTLLGNALDNALTAADTAGENAYISVTADRLGLQRSVLIRNSFDGIVEKKENVFLSRKRKNAPGVGMSSMQSICDRYGVMMDVRVEGNTFNLLLLFP